MLLAASFTATLDRSTMTLGESVTLSLTFTGGQPQTPPTPLAIPNLQIDYLGPSSQFTVINGQVSSTVTHNFTMTPRQPGDYTIPSLTAEVGSEKLHSEPLSLKVLKPGAPPPEAISSGSQLAFVKLVLPKKQLYFGELTTAELQLYLRSEVRGIDQFQLAAFQAEGFNVGKLVQGSRRQAQIANAVYTVIPVLTSLKPVKTGALTVGPVTVSVVLEVASANRRRGGFNPFEDWPGFSGFGNTEQKQLSLATDQETVQVLPLPGENVPPGFNGAVGSFTMTASAGPTNLAAGDPITLHVRISGRGALDSLALPEQSGWRDFKTYPPTTKVETTDDLGLQGTKTFEQVVVPQSPDIKALPPVSFSFFDPEQKSYRTLTQPAVPLVVRPAGAAPAPTVAATARSRAGQSAADAGHRPHQAASGAVAQIAPPLVQAVLVPGAPGRALCSPGSRPSSGVAARSSSPTIPACAAAGRSLKIIRQGLLELRQLAADNKSDDFFATLVRLLQEQLGERLDLPASAITEAVIEEHLRPRGVPEATLASLRELFQTCNLARYAPIKTSQELAAIIPKFEAAPARTAGVESVRDPMTPGIQRNRVSRLERHARSVAAAGVLA